jgi:hypothetical protein
MLQLWGCTFATFALCVHVSSISAALSSFYIIHQFNNGASQAVEAALTS